MDLKQSNQLMKNLSQSASNNMMAAFTEVLDELNQAITEDELLNDREPREQSKEADEDHWWMKDEAIIPDEAEPEEDVVDDVVVEVVDCEEKTNAGWGINEKIK